MCRFLFKLAHHPVGCKYRLKSPECAAASSLSSRYIWPTLLRRQHRTPFVKHTLKPHLFFVCACISKIFFLFLCHPYMCVYVSCCLPSSCLLCGCASLLPKHLIPFTVVVSFGALDVDRLISSGLVSCKRSRLMNICVSCSDLIKDKSFTVALGPEPR